MPNGISTTHAIEQLDTLCYIWCASRWIFFPPFLIPKFASGYLKKPINKVSKEEQPNIRSNVSWSIRHRCCAKILSGQRNIVLGTSLSTSDGVSTAEVSILCASDLRCLPMFYRFELMYITNELLIYVHHHTM